MTTDRSPGAPPPGPLLPARRRGGSRRWSWAFTALATSVAALHVSSWFAYPFDVDPINFRVALEVYDVSIDAPHPPGYPLFVALGRAAARLVGAHYAYQLVNLLLLLVGCTGVFVGLRTLGHPAVGLAAAALLATHPLVWSATVVPESYVSDAAFAGSVLALVASVGRGRVRPLVGFALLFFGFGLFRVVTVAMLAPFGVVGTFLVAAPESRVRRAGEALVGGGLGAVAAYACTVAFVGGLDVFRENADRVMGHAMRSVSVLAGAPAEAHAQMVTRLVGWAALWASPALVAATATAWARGDVAERLRVGAPWVAWILTWVLPAFAFYSLVYYLKPTYQLVYLGAFQVAFAGLVHRALLPERPRAAWTITALLAAGQLAFFQLAPHGLPAPLQRLTRVGFATRDASWTRLEAALSAEATRDRPLLWLGHPHLLVHSLRLVDWAGPVFVSEASHARWLLLDPRTMRWSGATPQEIARAIRRTEGAVAVLPRRSEGMVQSVDAPGGDLTPVDGLLRRVRPRAPALIGPRLPVSGL